MRALTVTFVALLLLPAGVMAQSKRYSVERISINALVTRDGTLEVEEDLTYRFRGSFTYAYRDIPQNSTTRISQLAVSEPGVAYSFSDGKLPGTFRVEEHRGTTRITWYFNAHNSAHTFRIAYRLTGAIHRYVDTGELYHKFVGGDWDRPIGAVHVELRFPEHVAQTDLQAWAHGPLQGTVTPGDSVVRFDVAPLPARTFWEGRVLFPPAVVGALTVADATPERDAILAEEKTFAERANQQRLALAERQRTATAEAARREALFLPFFGASLGLAFAGFLVWGINYAQHGRPYHVEPGPSTTEFPSTHPPAVIAYLMTRRVDASAMVGTLLDLAQRGILSIRETERVTRGFFGEKTQTDYEFTVTRSLVRTAEPFERHLMEFLLKEAQSEGTFSMSGLQKAASRQRSSFQKWYRRWVSDVKDVARSLDLFEPRNHGATALIVLTGAVIALAGLVLSVISASPAGVPAVLGGIVVACLSGTLTRRTPHGQRLFIEWSAARRTLKGLSTSAEPITLDSRRWGRYLALAIVFGMHKRLLPRLQPLDASGELVYPAWYAGSGNLTANMSTFSTNMSAMVTSMSTSMSSASGAGGGASAGGGGGSGGGGGGAG